MTAVYFYHLTDSPLEATLPSLLQKCGQAGWRVLVRGTSKDRVDWLDAKLWTIGDGSFLAHGVAGGAHDELQPVLLSTGTHPAPAGGCLMSIDGADVTPDEVQALARVCILFDGADDQALTTARAQWKVITDAGLAAQYWAQEAGSWVKKSEKAAAAT